MDAKARPLAGRHRIAHELREYAGIIWQNPLARPAVQTMFLGFGTPAALSTPVEFARLATADSAKGQAAIRRLDIRPN